MMATMLSREYCASCVLSLLQKVKKHIPRTWEGNLVTRVRDSDSYFELKKKKNTSFFV